MVTSYNNWPASRDPKALGVVPLAVNGVEFLGGVKGGDVHTVHHYFWTQFDKRVQRLRNPGCWGYSYRQNRNADNLSCHSSATATDGNAPMHPNGIEASRNFTRAQIEEIHKILAEVDHVLHWGGDWHHPLTPDPMHVEIHGTAAEVAAVARRLEDDMADPATQAKLDAMAKELATTHENVNSLKRQMASVHDRLGDVLAAVKAAKS